MALVQKDRKCQSLITIQSKPSLFPCGSLPQEVASAVFGSCACVRVIMECFYVLGAHTHCWAIVHTLNGDPLLSKSFFIQFRHKWRSHLGNDVKDLMKVKFSVGGGGLEVKATKRHSRYSKGTVQRYSKDLAYVKDGKAVWFTCHLF